MANWAAQYATISSTTMLMPNDSQVPLPAERKTRNGSSAIAALGAMLATDWASTSGVERTRFCRVMPLSTAISLETVAIRPFL